MICRLMTTFTSDPPQDSVGSSMHVLGKSFVGTTASSDNLHLCSHSLLAEA